MNDNLMQLLDADRAFAKMSIEKGAEAAFAFYLTDGAIQLPQNQPVQHNKIMKTEPGEALNWEPKGGKVATSGDLGYTWGEYIFTLANGKVIPGKYLNVWVKQKDGSWKVEVDMGNAT
jgi:ketosteroid isomerase-like protein